MAFNKVDSNDTYLKIVDFDNASVANKICYVVECKSGVSVISKGYFRFIIRTSDDVSIPAMLFDVEDFVESGVKASAMSGKFVKVSGIPNVYNGGYTLQLSSIDIVPTPNVTEASKFLGRVENLLVMYKDIEHGCRIVNPNFEIPIIWKSKSYPTISNGKVGGYVKFVWQWLFMISIYSDTYGEELQKIFSELIVYYAKYLDRVALFSVVTDLDKLEIVKEVSTDSSEQSRILIDSLSAVLGLSKPEHLYSHILATTFDTVHSLLCKGELWKALPKGGVRQLTDGILKRF